MPTLSGLAPYLPVPAIAKAVAYYEQTLGFTPTYVAGDVFAIMKRDTCSLMFKKVPDPAKIVPNEAQGGTWDVFFWIDDAKGLHAELAERGATVVYGPLVQEDYQMLEFAVRDLNGYVLGFGQRMETVKT